MPLEIAYIIKNVLYVNPKTARFQTKFSKHTPYSGSKKYGSRCSGSQKKK